MKTFGGILVIFLWQVIKHAGNKSQALNLEVNFLIQHRKRVVMWAKESRPQSSITEFTQVIFLLSLVIQSKHSRKREKKKKKERNEVSCSCC